MVFILEHAGGPIGNVFGAGYNLPFILETLKNITHSGFFLNYMIQITFRSVDLASMQA